MTHSQSMRTFIGTKITFSDHFTPPFYVEQHRNTNYFILLTKHLKNWDLFSLQGSVQQRNKNK